MKTMGISHINQPTLMQVRHPRLQTQTLLIRAASSLEMRNRSLTRWSGLTNLDTESFCNAESFTGWCKMRWNQEFETTSTGVVDTISSLVSRGLEKQGVRL